MTNSAAAARGAAWLFVPGDRPERFDKAASSGASVVILDLEDAVAPSAKAPARAAVRAWLADRWIDGRAAAAHACSGMAVVLRVNAAETPEHDADLALVALPGVAAVMLPKAETSVSIAAVIAAGGRAVVPLIESAAGFAALDAVAGAPGVERLAFGSLDLRVDLGMHEATEDDLLYFRSRLLLASRLDALAAPLDGVTPALDDADRLAVDVQRARRLGFGGKLLIHPRQVAPTQAGFAPEARDVAWAQRVLVAVARAGEGATTVDGAMVDRPVVLRAQAVLARAGASV